MALRSSGPIGTSLPALAEIAPGRSGVCWFSALRSATRGAVCAISPRRVEGELSDIFAAVEAIQARLDRPGVQRALLELRLQFEPRPETLEHQAEGIAAGDARGSGASSALGLAEQDLREQVADELVRAMRAEGGKPTVHAIADSVARVVEEDHLRMLEQLERAGVRLEPPVGAR